MMDYIAKQTVVVMTISVYVIVDVADIILKTNMIQIVGGKKLGKKVRGTHKGGKKNRDAATEVNLKIGQKTEISEVCQKTSPEDPQRQKTSPEVQLGQKTNPEDPEQEELISAQDLESMLAEEESRYTKEEIKTLREKREARDKAAKLLFKVSNDGDGNNGNGNGNGNGKNGKNGKKNLKGPAQWRPPDFTKKKLWEECGANFVPQSAVNRNALGLTTDISLGLTTENSSGCRLTTENLQKLQNFVSKSESYRLADVVSTQQEAATDHKPIQQRRHKSISLPSPPIPFSTQEIQRRRWESLQAAMTYRRRNPTADYIRSSAAMRSSLRNNPQRNNSRRQQVGASSKQENSANLVRRNSSASDLQRLSIREDCEEDHGIIVVNEEKESAGESGHSGESGNPSGHRGEKGNLGTNWIGSINYGQNVAQTIAQNDFDNSDEYCNSPRCNAVTPRHGTMAHGTVQPVGIVQPVRQDHQDLLSQQNLNSINDVNATSSNLENSNCYGSQQPFHSPMQHFAVSTQSPFTHNEPPTDSNLLSHSITVYGNSYPYQQHLSSLLYPKMALEYGHDQASPKSVATKSFGSQSGSSPRGSSSSPPSSPSSSPRPARRASSLGGMVHLIGRSRKSSKASEQLSV